MDRGGTITWHLDADDSGFNRTVREVRRESKQTARDVDRDLKKVNKSSGDNLGNFRRELGQTASFVRNFQVAMRGFNMTTMILGVTAASGLILELGSAAVVASGSLIALPGIMSSIGGIFGTVKVATLGLGDAFKAVLKGDTEDLAEAMQKLSPAAREVVRSFSRIREAFKPVQLAVQDAFFVGLGKQMEDVAATSLPMLREGMVNVATATNGLLKEVARVSKEPFFQGAIRDTLSQTAETTGILQGAIEPLARSLAGLLQVGRPFTNMLAEWAVSLSEQAAAYASSEKGQRQMTSAINLGIQALGKLLDLAISVGKLLVNMFKLSNDQGVSLIDTLIKVFDAMNKWLETEEGQRQMQALLTVTNEVLIETLKVVGDVALIILDIIEGFNNLPDPIKNVVIQFLAWTAVLTPIAGYVSALGTSLNTTFEIIKLGGGTLRTGATALATFGRGWQLAAQGIGMAGVQGSKAAKLGVIVRSSFGTISRVAILLSRLLFTQLIPALFETGAAFLVAIGPVGWIILAVVALIAIFVLLWNKFEGFRQFWKDAWAGLQIIAEAAVSWFKDTLVPIFTAIWDGIITGVKAVWNFIRPILQFILDLYIIVWGTILIVTVRTLQFLFNIYKTVFLFVLGIYIKVFTTIRDFTITIWQGIVNIITAVLNFIIEQIRWAFALIREIVIFVFTEVRDFVLTIWQTIFGIISGIVQSIINFFAPAFNWLLEKGKDIVRGLINGIKAVAGEVWGAIKGVADQIGQFFAGVGSWLYDAGRALFQGFINGIKSIAGEVHDAAESVMKRVKNLFPHSPAKEGPFSGQGYTTFSGQALMTDFGKGIITGATSAVSATAGVLGNITNALNSGGLNGQGLAINTGAIPAASFQGEGGDIVAPSGGDTTVNQTNNIYNEIDMERSLRDLSWRLQN